MFIPSYPYKTNAKTSCLYVYTINTLNRCFGIRYILCLMRINVSKFIHLYILNHYQYLRVSISVVLCVHISASCVFLKQSKQKSYLITLSVNHLAEFYKLLEITFDFQNKSELNVKNFKAIIDVYSINVHAHRGRLS